MNARPTDPYLSVVVTSRNDDHGGDLLRRMQVFVDALASQCERHRLAAELIVVEWNPPCERPRLADALSWPLNQDWCKVRIIEVAPSIHRRFQYSAQLPLFQMISKNVGIRRALGEHVLATNIDLLFSDELIKFLATGTLKAGKYYRADRCDVGAGVMSQPTLDAQLAYCWSNLLRVFGLDGEVQDGQVWLAQWQTPFLVRTWRHLLATRVVDCLLPGPLGRITERLLSIRVEHVLLPTATVRGLQKFLFPPPQVPLLHTNACGDFTLMSKEDWFKLRAYPELEMWSWHLDSLLLYIAHYSGLREVRLKHPVFHIEHGGGWTPQRGAQLFDRIKQLGVAFLADQDLKAWALQMCDNRQPIILNHANWGLADESLPEIRVESSKAAAAVRVA